MNAYETALTDVFERSIDKRFESAEEERDAIVRAAFGDQESFLALIYAYGPALRNGLRWYRRAVPNPNPTDVEDVRSGAVAGLFDAIIAFDPERFDRLAATAPQYILKGVSEAAKVVSPFAIPSRTLSRFFGILRAAEGNVEEAAASAPDYHMSTEVFLSVLDAVRNIGTMDNIRGNSPEAYTANAGGFAEEDDWSRRQVSPLPGASQDAYADAEDRILVEVAFDAVDTLEKDVCKLAYGFTDYDPLPDAEIGARMGFSRPKIQRVRTGALDKMRSALGVA